MSLPPNRPPIVGSSADHGRGFWAADDAGGDLSIMDIPETIEDFRTAIEAEQERKVEFLRQKRDSYQRYLETGEHTPKSTRELLDNEIRLCGMRIAAMHRGLEALTAKNRASGFWHYSDMLLAELQNVCEAHGRGDFITEARAILQTKINPETK